MYSVYLLYWYKTTNTDAAPCGKACMRERREHIDKCTLKTLLHTHAGTQACVRESIDEIAQAFVRYSVYKFY